MLVAGILQIKTNNKISRHTYIHTYISSDINRLYVKRAEGGHGLKNIKDMYECRTISLLEHLEEAGDTHGLLKLVREHEGQGIVLLGNEFG